MNKKSKTMAEVTADYKEFVKGKETNKNGKQLFDKVIKKAAKPKKQRAAK